jgi:hypothetical protein
MAVPANDYTLGCPKLIDHQTIVIKHLKCDLKAKPCFGSLRKWHNKMLSQRTQGNINESLDPPVGPDQGILVRRSCIAACNSDKTNGLVTYRYGRGIAGPLSRTSFAYAETNTIGMLAML